MANFNLAEYETVEERLRRFWGDEANADARIVTVNHTTDRDRASGTWVVEARVYLSTGDQAADLPKATGWAFEVDGGSGANRTAALENAETSAIGRALANMNYSGNKRTSREEMQKVQRDVQPQRNQSWGMLIDLVKTAEDARKLWAEAHAAGASESVLKQIEARGKALA